MNLKGIVEIQIKDALTGNLKQTIIQENLITDFYLLNAILAGVSTSYDNQTSTSTGRFGQYIVISSQNIVPNRTTPLLTGIMAFGGVIPALTSPDLITTSTPIYGQFGQRFSAPVSTRTIYTVALTQETTTTNTTAIVQAYLQLVVPCTQTPTDIVDIFYRIQFPANVGTYGLNNYQVLAIAKKFMGASGANEYFPFDSKVTWHGNVSSSLTQLNVATQPSTSNNFNTYGAGGLFERKLTFSNTIANNVGRLLGTVGHTSSTGSYPPSENVRFWHKIKPSSISPVQNLFSHNVSATKPFYDAAFLASSAGTVALSAASWTNPDFPKMYRVDITGSGLTGVGTYKFRVRNHLGFVGNLYEDLYVPCSVVSASDNLTTYGGHNVLGNNVVTTGIGLPFLKYNSRTILALDVNGIVKIDIIDGTTKVFDATTTPALSVTNIGQVEVDNSGNIWVACRDTGLWKINAAGTTSTHYTTPTVGIPSNQCYGVDVGNGRIWAIFNGGLSSSVDSGANWVAATFTNATITADWTLVRFLRADPTHANNRLAVTYRHSSGNLRVVWWDLTTGGVGTDSTINIRAIAASILAGSYTVGNSYTIVAIGTTDFTAIGASSNTIGVTFTATGAGTGTGTAQETSKNWYQCFNVSDNQSIWGTTSIINSSCTYFTYGTASTVTTTTYGITLQPEWQKYAWFEIDPDGNDALVLFFSNNNFSFAKVNTTMANISMTSTQGTLRNDIGTGDIILYLYPKCYMGNALMLCSTLFSVTYGSNTLFMKFMGDKTSATSGLTSHLIWKQYGWNGSAWIQNNVNSKTLHASVDSLHDGLQITFNSTPGPFVNTEYYTVGVIDGIWSDGSTDISTEYGLFLKQMTQTTDLSSATIPAANTVLLAHNSNLTFVDQKPTYTSVGRNYIRNTNTSGSYDAGGRSDLVLTGDCFVEFKMTGRDPSNLQRGVLSGAQAGLSSDAYGSQATLTGTSIDFAFRTLGSYVAHTTSGIVWQVIENGAISTPTRPSGPHYEGNVYKIEKTGTIVRYYVNGTLVYTSAVASASSVHFETILSYYSTVEDIRIVQSKTDRFVDMGISGNLSGKFDPNFIYINYDAVNETSVLINGVTATILLGDTETALTAGKVSILPSQGVMRLSAADATLPLSATYTYLKN